jgi:arginine repressor
MKSWRQAQILEVIDHEAVASQELLRQRLADRGITATPATI